VGVDEVLHFVQYGHVGDFMALLWTSHCTALIIKKCKREQDGVKTKMKDLKETFVIDSSLDVDVVV
jgi:hypothetical protein